MQELKIPQHNSTTKTDYSSLHQPITHHYTMSSADIVFCCTGCGVPIIRDSEAHDHARFDPNNEDDWYCVACPVPDTDDEDDEEDDSSLPMSSTMNIKGNRQVVVAQYRAESVFKLPDGLDLNDKNIVAEWGVKWDKLWITFTDGRLESIEPVLEAQMDCKYAYESEIEPAADVGYEYEEDEADEERSAIEQKLQKYNSELKNLEDEESKLNKEIGNIMKSILN